jgi:hypothetical protein
MSEEAVVVRYRMLVVADIEAMVKDMWLVILKVGAVVVVALDRLMQHENHVCYVFDFSTNFEFCHMLH